MRRYVPAALLAVFVSVMVWAARTPEAGLSWRVAFVISALLASGALLWSIRVYRPSTRVMIGVAIGLRLIALPLAPTLSDDGHRYLWDGYVVLEGLNPYAETPREHLAGGVIVPIDIDDLNSPDYHSVYPPTSQFFFVVAAWGGRGDARVSWWLLKLLTVLVELLGLWALARVLPNARLELYAWHPVAVIEVAGQGHSEGLAIGLLALGLSALLRQKLVASGTWLALAGWVKLWPFAILAVWGQRRQRLVFTTAVVGALAAVPIALNASGTLESLGLYAGTFDFYSLPYIALKSLMWPLAGTASGTIASAAMGLVGIASIAVIAKYQFNISLRVENATAGIAVAVVLISPTLHPWHLLPVLWAATILGKGRGSCALLWLVSWSPVTYLIYVGLPLAHTVALIIGWGGAVTLAVRESIPWILERRGEAKWKRVRSHIGAGGRWLDLGGAEGFVASAAQRDGRETVVADIQDVRRVPVPFLPVESEHVDCVAQAFDGTLLIFVLHHADEPERLLREAMRVSRDTLIVWETTPRRWYPKPLLQFVDRTANRLRPKGHYFPSAQLRTPQEWEKLFSALGLQIQTRENWGVLHPQTLWHLRPAGRPLAPEAS